ncbi:MAG TPA: TolC family protein [Ferruginibacter sp.]|nr:TolC family protein [Ferruginibacter sp.]HNO99082.1 TolC family protein [Ferruginibacter sp.]
MKRIILFLTAWLLAACSVSAQSARTLTLEQCYDLLAKTSPLAQQKALTITAGNLAEKNLNLKWLPQADLNGQATYQSDVTSVPIKLPNLAIDEPSKDQYKGTLDLVQPVFDGGVTGTQKKIQRATTNIESQKVEVDLYQLRSRVNTYFFTALLMDENIRIMELTKADLENNIRKVSAQAANGIATNSNVDVLKAELLKVSQRIIEYQANRKSAIEMLDVLTGSPIDAHTSFVKPAMLADKDETISRPELKLFDYQKQQFRLQSRLIQAKANPKVSLFGTGGYGRPALNMLKNEFQWYYLGGVKLSIPITGQFTRQREMKVMRMQEQIVEKQREAFLSNNRQLQVQQKNELEKYGQLIGSDAEIVGLRTKIKENASVRLANGIITSSDYITELNAENQAMLAQKLHEVQWLQAQYNYKLIIGK